MSWRAWLTRDWTQSAFVMYSMCCTGDISLDELQDLPYTEAVIRETTRMFPAGAYAWREAKQDMLLGGANPSCRFSTLHSSCRPMGMMLRSCTRGHHALYGKRRIHLKPLTCMPNVCGQHACGRQLGCLSCKQLPQLRSG